jgi:hypothetical protein
MKTINAQQAKISNSYKNTKLEVTQNQRSNMV